MPGIDDVLDNALKASVGKHSVKGIITGTAVNIRDSLCDLEREDEAKLFDVMLQAIEDNVNSRIIIRPKEGSTVICGVVESNEAEAIVLQCSEIAQVYVKVDTTEFTIDENGFTMKKGADDMWDAVKLLFDGLAPILIYQGQNPDKIKLAQSEAKFKTIFNGT